MLPVLIDETSPIVVVVAPPRMDLVWIEAQKRAFEAVYLRAEPYAVITYNGFVRALPGARERKALVDWANDPRQRAIQRRLCAGASTQLGSAAQRAFLQALFWMWDPPTPQRTHATLDESITWCLEQLARAGAPSSIPAMLRRRVHASVARLHGPGDRRAPAASLPR